MCWFRLFLKEEFYEFVKNVDGIVVFDRNYFFGMEGIFFMEVKGVFYNIDVKLFMKNYIVGFGGRDFMVNDVRKIVENMKVVIEKGEFDVEVDWYYFKR